MTDVKNESQLIGEFMQLRKKFNDMAEKMETYAGYRGNIREYVDASTFSSSDIHSGAIPDYKHNKIMKLDPDHIVKLVNEFRDVRVAYEKAYKEYKQFLNTHQTIPKKAGIAP